MFVLISNMTRWKSQAALAIFHLLAVAPGIFWLSVPQDRNDRRRARATPGVRINLL